MANESQQHKLDRVRRPRVHITYDVEIEGAIQKKSLPFVVGVLADLSGNPEQELRPMAERKFVEIDRDNFHSVLAGMKPRLTFRVPNRLGDDGSLLNVELKFRSLDDFAPDKVAEQVPPLKKLMDARNQLKELLTKLDSDASGKLDELLLDIMKNTEQQKALQTQLAADSGPSAPKKEG
jgi:type VI secretion system protein ImpB